MDEKPFPVLAEVLSVNEGSQHNPSEVEALCLAAAPGDDEPAGNTSDSSSNAESHAGRMRDEDFITQFRGSNDKVARLWDGNIEGYPSRSEADCALCVFLAMATKGDRAMIDRLFRRSALYRAKWDERHGAQTYGELTVENAIRFWRKHMQSRDTNDGEETKIDAPGQASPASPYEADNGGFIWKKLTKDGESPIRITNFLAKILRQIRQDDGADVRRQFEIEATLNGRRTTFTIAAQEFSSLNWVIQNLGVGAIVSPGQSHKEHVRAAIQYHSHGADDRDVFAHLGWRKIDGKWVYLHGAGAIGTEGLRTDINVALDGPLARYGFKALVQGAELTAAITASLSILELAPLTVTVPLVAAIYLAPLIEWLGDYGPDFVVWLYGPSGVYKSELAALAMAHYGAFSRTTLTVTFAATANAIERIGFLAKDSLLVVDDYHPTQNAQESYAMNQVVSRLLRTMGNGRGRLRMKADTSLRADYPPRCLIIATAERMPEGHSTMARLFSVPVEGGAVNLEVLTRLQNQTAHLNQALAGCIQWLLSHAERLREGLRARFVYYRTRAQRDGGHKREPAQIAHLMLGLETFLDFAVAHAAMTAEARVAWLEEAWTALRLIAREHGAQLEDQKPVARFLAILADGFASKAAYLEAKDGGDPEEARLWGWETLSYMRDGEECYRNQHPARAINLGRVDKDYLYLLPEATYQFLATAARAAGQTFPVEPKTLLRRLEEAQVIETRKDLNGNMNRVLPVRFGRTTLRVIKLYRTAFEGQGESVTSVTCVTSVTSQTRKTPQENDTREANPCASQHPLYNPPPIKQTLHTSQASQTLHDAPVIDLTGEA